MDLDWRSCPKPRREREYSPSSCIDGDYRPYIQAYVERSAAARRAHPPRRLRYGPGERQTIDLFIPRGVARPPVLVFFHGGYWQELSKQESAFAAPAVPGVRHRLRRRRLHAGARQATLSAIVAECRAAVAGSAAVGPSGRGRQLGRRASGGDGRRAWERAVKGAVLVSGIYDLEPLIGTSIDAALGLDPPRRGATARCAGRSRDFPPSLVCWGENETDQFKRQSELFPGACTRPVQCRSNAPAGTARRHPDLADPATELGRRTLDLIQ